MQPSTSDTIREEADTDCVPMTVRSANAKGKAALALYRIPKKGASAVELAALTEQEREILKAFQHAPRRESFIAGRWAAKQALAAVDGHFPPEKFSVVPGIFGQPVVTFPKGDYQVSLSHSKELAAALAFPETHPMGIDVERIGPMHRDLLQDHFTGAEQTFLHTGPLKLETGIGLFWNTKEALSKTIRTGLTTSLLNLETCEWTWNTNRLQLRYTQFPQYQALGFVLGNHTVALCYPSLVQIDLDVTAVEERWGPKLG